MFGEVAVGDAKALQAMGDALREQLRSGVGLLAARLEDGKGSLLVVVTDDLRERGIRADAIVREIAAVLGPTTTCEERDGKGHGKLSERGADSGLGAGASRMYRVARHCRVSTRAV